MAVQNQYAPVQQSAPSGTGATTIINASGDSRIYCDLVTLVITTPNAAASVITISDGNKTVLVLNYPNAALAPGTPLVLDFCDVPIEQSKANAAWTFTPSVNASGYNVTAQYVLR